jgi:hypothetical protein
MRNATKTLALGDRVTDKYGEYTGTVTATETRKLVTRGSGRGTNSADRHGMARRDTVLYSVSWDGGAEGQYYQGELIKISAA